MLLIPLKLKRCVNMPSIIGYVHDRHKIQEMSNKAILENGGTLRPIPDCCKKQKMRNKSVVLHALEFVPDYYKTQEICNKAVNTSPSVIQFVAKCYKTQGMYVKAVDTCIFAFYSVPD